jgi:hypothetical protein
MVKALCHGSSLGIDYGSIALNYRQKRIHMTGVIQLLGSSLTTPSAGEIIVTVFVCGA